MQQDMRDGAEAVVRSGRADRSRLCIAGWSYGGYATMTGSFVDGDFYKCAMAGAGVSDMVGMQRWTRYGDPRNNDVVEGGGDGLQSISYQYWSQAMGDPARESDMMNRFSAAKNADKINMPLMLIHGDEDEIVPVEQSEIMAEAMRKAGKRAELIILKDDGHQWAPMTVQGRRTVLVESLRFFQQHIGPGWTAARTN
jgi:dipeptidyl aminopeptidase/acylaminoacyl peptidase